ATLADKWNAECGTKASKLWRTTESEFGISKNIMDVNNPAVECRSPTDHAAIGLELQRVHILHEIGFKTAGGYVLDAVVLQAPHVGFLCSAQVRRRLDQVVEYLLQVKRRPADNFEHIGSRCLLLKRLAQLAEQSRIFDRYHRLAGKALDQFDLLLTEGTNVLAIDGNGADQLIVLKHWHTDKCARASQFDEGRTRETLFRRKVRDVKQLFHLDDAPQTRCGHGYDRIAPAQFLEGFWSTMKCSDPQLTAIEQREIADLGPADPHRILEQDLKHWR